MAKWLRCGVEPLVILCLSSRLCAQAAGAETRPAIPEQLVSVIEEYSKAGTDRMTSISVRSAGFQMAPGEGDWAAVAWAPLPDAGEWRVEWAAMGERRSLSATPIDAPEKVSVTRLTWTGSEWFAWKSTAKQVQVLVTPQPTMNPEWDFVSLFNGGPSWPSFAGPQSLADMLHTFTLLESKASEGSTTHVFAWTEKPDSPQLRLRISSIGSKQRLSSVEMRTFQPADHGVPPTLFAKKVLEFDWSDAGDDGLPRRAKFMQGRTDGAATEIEVHTLLIERTSTVALKPGPQAEECLKPPVLHAGDAVIDRCYGLAYNIGDTTLFMNSVRVDLKKPIDHRITTDLSEIVGEVTGVKGGAATTTEQN